MTQYFSRHVNGILYFRIVMPKAIQAARKRKSAEIRLSLKTRNRRVATPRAMYLAVYYTNLFNYHLMDMNLNNITPEEWEDMYKKGYQLAQEAMFIGAIPNVVERFEEKDSWEDCLSPYDKQCLHVVTKHLQNNQAEEAKLKKWFQEEKEKLANASTLSPRGSNEAPLLNEQLSALIPAFQSIEAVTISEAKESFLKLRKETKNITKDRASEEVFLDEFLEIINVMDTSGITNNVLDQYGALIRNLPPNRAKKAEFETTLSAVTNNTGPVIASRTLNKRLEHVGRFLKHCSARGWVSQALTIEILNSYRKKENDSAKKEILREEHLETLFTSALYNGESPAKEPYQYWLPILSVYTGARLGELIQLKCSDIEIKDEYTLLSLTDEGEGQTLKTRSSKRKIPLHQDVLDLGFNEFVQLTKRNNLDDLFQFKRAANKTDAAQKWMSRTFQSAFPEGPKFSHHCFRHTFISSQRMSDAKTSILKNYVGHEVDDITYGIYGGEPTPEDYIQILKELDAIKIPVQVQKWGDGKGHMALIREINNSNPKKKTRRRKTNG